jgi:26S proteasome regulatory subunit N12
MIQKPFSMYNNNTRTLLPESTEKWEVVGLYLLYLLSSNRIADFHTELELVPVENQNNKFIKYTIRLEQELMEGSYSQVWDASQHAPAASYLLFVSSLVDAVRERIMSCCEKAYSDLSIINATKLLNLQSPQVTAEFCAKKGWKIVGDKFVFGDDDNKNIEIPAHKMIGQVLSYANELERIV